METRKHQSATEALDVRYILCQDINPLRIKSDIFGALTSFNTEIAAMEKSADQIEGCDCVHARIFVIICWPGFIIHLAGMFLHGSMAMDQMC